MAKFTVDVNGNQAQLELIFHLLSNNTWSVVAGDGNILPAVNGTWDSSGTERIVNFSDEKGVNFMTFTQIPIAVLSTDKFKNLKVGDTGDAILTSVDGVMWIFDAP